ncbi:Endonuclease/exonuclease/phosphatase [Phycomyces blakesleeanus]|uniref:sphingomyelin phosphodiesterase n=1 Tax=Phycomyces blakesleeanus TaxID=4837 RepID=A0ABR3AKE4_PHYBL
MASVQHYQAHEMSELATSDEFNDDYPSNYPSSYPSSSREGAPLLGDNASQESLLSPTSTLAPTLQHKPSFFNRLRSLFHRDNQARFGPIDSESGPENNSTLKARKSRGCGVRISGCFVCLLVSGLALFLFLLTSTLYLSPASLPPTRLPDKSTNTTAQFLTLNIFMRPPGVKNNADDYKDERLDYIIRYILPEYDVVAIQEAFAFANRRIDRLIREARYLGFNYHVASPRHYPWELAADGGLLLLSRFPIKQSDVLEFPRGLHSDWLSCKGALHALIELNATRRIHLYTSHTQASYDVQGAFNEEDTRMRYSQFGLLHRFIHSTTAQDTDPILLTGDLNVDASAHNQSTPTASSKAYTQMMDILSGKGVWDTSLHETMWNDTWRVDWKDMGYTTFGHHPVTFGDKLIVNHTEVPAETALTHTDQWMTLQSLDRILWASRNTTELAIHNVTIEPFAVRDNTALTKQQKAKMHFSQISGTL